MIEMKSDGRVEIFSKVQMEVFQVGGWVHVKVRREHKTFKVINKVNICVTGRVRRW